MDANVLQTLRYKLQKRQKRINTANFQIFHSVVIQTFRFLMENAVVRGILEDLERRVPSAEKDSEQLFNGTLLAGESELGHIALAYALLKRTVASGHNKEIELGHVFGHCSKHAEAAECFAELFIEPLFDYIDEQIDDRRNVLGLLRKYKHHVEWFRRDDLRTRFESDTQKGEKKLALDLYAYLHDQGLEFSIEPSSVSGEADLISAQSGEDRLVADVKIFDPGRSKGTSYLCAGFAQVYQYTKDYNDPFGYLVVYKACREDLSVNARDQDVAIPFFTHNNKTIFVMVIDIFDYPEPASKRGHLKSYELVESELIHTIAEVTRASGAS
jgi:hypothetical protein